MSRKQAFGQHSPASSRSATTSIGRRVLSFIESDALPLYESVEVWEGMQMAVAERLEGLLP
jgi:hypothetical protein